FDNEEAAFDGLMADDIDVTDIEYDDGKVSVFVSHTDYFKAKQSLLNSCGELDFEVDEVQFISHDYIFIENDDTVLFDKFMTMLNELDDVQQVYHNVKLL
ncbi:MAG: YebC/PmpR family DNA-binding transcriptional regulator, partial [Nitrosomonadales bacterium]|nr:YebC/PmpR family DNA-binding transcriptional regulator [Nitrosomonadales bacterium]